MALLEGLVIRHPDGLSPLPGVAETWEISSNGLIYTFNLRKDASGQMAILLTHMILYIPGRGSITIIRFSIPR